MVRQSDRAHTKPFSRAWIKLLDCADACGTKFRCVYARRMRTFSARERSIILHYIDEHLASDLSLSGLCGIVGLRPSQFKALFRRSLGISVHQYIIRRRIDRAIGLLGESGAELGDVAEVAGFTDPSHMARWMRRLAGVTPSALMRDSRLRNLRDHPSERSEMEPNVS
jgi:AraC-like DNA-binding protein